MLTLIGLLGAKLAVCSPGGEDCATAAQAASTGNAIAICQREYDRTRLPATGAMLADLLRQRGNSVAATALASTLLGTNARSDAAEILGHVAMSEGWFDDAANAFEYARGLHGEQHQHAEMAKDNQSLAEIHAKRQWFSEALRSLDDCISEAHVATNTMIEGGCHLAAARVLTRIGFSDLAEQELDRAIPQLDSDRDHAWLEYARGNIYQWFSNGHVRRGHYNQAVLSLEHALRLAKRAQLTALTLSAELNLVYSLAEIGQSDEAESHLTAATQLDRDNLYKSQRTQLAARIAYRRGNLALAWSLNEHVYSTLDHEYDRDEMIEICVLQARIALANNELVAAERWARDGVKYAEEVRAAQTALELRSWVQSSRREPYELLFTVLARAQRFEEAFLVLDSWQGRTMLDAMAQPRRDASLDLRGAAGVAERLGRWLPVVSSAPFVKPGDGRAVIDTLRAIDLLALVVADHDVWCLTASHGQFHAYNLGQHSELQEQFDRFVAAPNDRGLASDLGARILRGEIFRPTHDALHVLLDGPLTTLPIAALRRDDRLLIAARPVVRVLKLPEAPCVRSERPTHATVLADASGNLPNARTEAGLVSSLLSTTSLVGATATSKALFSTTRDSVLHIAVHSRLDSSGGGLDLFDQRVSALEISARKLGPLLVVLSSSNTATSDGGELGSLATAFLSAGSTQVVATLGRVTDEGAREVVTRFYRASGVTDPVQTLASIQTALANTNNRDWPYFVVFGKDLCTP